MELNGLVGTLAEWRKDRKRWCVRCHGFEDVLYIRSDNLCLVNGAPSSPKVESMVNLQASLDLAASEDAVPTAAVATSGSSPRVNDDVGKEDGAEASTQSPPSSQTAAEGESLQPPQENVAGAHDGDAASMPEVHLREDGDACISEMQRLQEDEATKIMNELEEPDVNMVLSCPPVEKFDLRSAAHATKGGQPYSEEDLGMAMADSQSRASLPPPPLKAIQSLWRLWYALIVLSLLELVLLLAAACIDRYWSPCRERLQTCISLHLDDCSGKSCRDGAPLWALVWPLASLFFIATPLHTTLRYVAGIGVTKASRCLGLSLVVTIAVAGLGATALSEISVAGHHYSMRCPLERSVGRCEAHVCPMPPCFRKSEFSPCACGRLEEAEMARALFLNGIAACHPYEWYPWQMGILEKILLRYETFACIFGPLECIALAAGGALLLVQLACCPVLFFSAWGAHEALIVFFFKEAEQPMNAEAVQDTPMTALPSVASS
jgi:hypothetical protein